MSEDDDLLFGDDDDDQDLLDACSLADADAAEVNSGPTSTHLQKLQRFFGHDKFRDLQWDIISSLVDEGDANRGRDYCIVMATGYGKSLCYQFPPVFLCKTALVVSPLIALMEDQVLGLETTGIRACFLGSAQKDKDTVYKNVKEDKYRVIYITPEFADSCLDLLQSLLPASRLCLIAIDEAHCVSQWGHDFRSSYRHLHRLREAYDQVPLLALTATATRDVIQDISDSLKLKRSKIVTTSFDRPNLYLEVASKTEVWSDLSSVMQMNAENSCLKFHGSTIIYCPTKKEVERVANALISHGLKVCMYHAGLPMPTRDASHKRFVRDQCDAIVCTVAFGMGINKPDVRNVVHYGAPKDMEAYYQEMGRAGRDGLKSTCKVFYGSGDFNTNRMLLQSIPDEKWRENRNTMLHRMEIFLGMKKSCRRAEILKHFGETLKESSRDRNNCCDNCTMALLGDPNKDKEEEEMVDVTADAKLLLESIKACGGYWGMGVPCHVLRGSQDKTVKEWLTKMPIFGKGKHKSKNYWQALGRCLVPESLVAQKLQGGNNFGRGGGRGGFNRGFTTFSISEKGQVFLDNPAAELMIVPTKELRQERFVAAAKPKLSLTPVAFNASATSGGGENSVSRVMRNALSALRIDVAADMNIPPYMVISEEQLQKMAEIRPSSRGSLKKMGLAEAKVDKFGEKFVGVIKSFCSSENLKMDQFPDSKEGTSIRDFSRLSLTTTVLSSLTLFFSHGEDRLKVAAARNLAETTIVGHLSEAIKQGVKIDLEKLGVTPSKRFLVEKIIATDPEVNHEVHRLAPIKHKCDEAAGDDKEETTWNDIKVTVALLIANFGVKENKVQWSAEKLRELQNNYHATVGDKQGDSVAVEEDTQDLDGSDTDLEDDSQNEIENDSPSETSMTRCKTESAAADECRVLNELKRSQSTSSQKRSHPDSAKADMRKKIKKHSLFQ